MIQRRHVVRSAIATAVLGFALPSAPVLSQQPGGPAVQQGQPAQKVAPRPVRKDRVFAKDLEGLWVARDYVEALRATRMPIAAARKAPPLVVQIRKDKRSYPILRTDFTRAILLRVVEVEPGAKPNEFRLVTAADDSGPVNSSDVTYVPFRGTKNPDGGFTKLSVADPQLSRKRHREIVRFDEGLGPLVNGIVIAGDYRDEQGRTWAFSIAGEATLPDGKFNYEIALAPQAGSCELIESAGEETAAAPKKRIGFAWKGAQLHLFEVSGTVGKDLHCAKQPLAVLTPAGDAKGAEAK